MLTFTEENELEIGNLTKAVGKITWQRKGGKEKSAIDFILYNREMCAKIKRIIIDEEKEFDLKSDHNMTIIEYRSQKIKEDRTLITTTRKWKRKKCRLEEI